MSFLWFFLAFVFLVGVLTVAYKKRQFAAKSVSLRKQAEEEGHDEDKINAALSAREFFLPSSVSTGLLIGTLLFASLGIFNKIWFYAEPGYVYHVRTIWGEERVIDSVGYSYHLFGNRNAWKKAMTIQASKGGSVNGNVNAESESRNSASASLNEINIMFLDQVDADASATARFRIPTDKETFLKMAHEYRTPANLLRTALIPAFKETLHATGSIMSAEEYYSGSRTQFNNEFEKQMQEGIFIVKRKEVRVIDLTSTVNSSANASKGDEQDKGEVQYKVVFKVEKEYDEAGLPKRKKQAFLQFGITVVEARITDLRPNDKFVDRMQLKQKASADRAIAREQRIQEQEQKLLVVAKGERKIAERQAAAKQEQIQKTTEAETTKQLAITAANQKLESARIEKLTAKENYLRDQIKAKSVKVLADATAYARKKKIQADNGLKIKTDAIVQMNKDNAEAFAKRAVPHTVVYQGGAGMNGLGTDGDIRTVAQTQMLKNLKALDLDIGIAPVRARRNK